MKRYITRHGQVSDDASYIDGHLYPEGDMPLSPLGREQARLLGERLKQIGFSGKIISSPYRRTLETACIIAEVLGARVIPFAPLREILRSQSAADKLSGLTLPEIKELYSAIDAAIPLEDRWWSPHAESAEDVIARVREGVEKIEQLYPDEEVLYVGHGASVDALLRVYKLRRPDTHSIPGVYNCSFSACDTENSKINFYSDTEHIPYGQITSNYRHKRDIDTELMTALYAGDIDISGEIESVNGKKLLHISDTRSDRYPFYKKLIESVKPDVILHTGDLADEVKVGRKKVREEYLHKIPFMLSILKNSGAEVIIVPGNNDIPDEIIRLAPFAKVLKTNSVIILDGNECRVGHQTTHMTYDKPWCFLGHGTTNYNWSDENNVPGEHVRLNASTASYVCSLSENIIIKIDDPK